MYVYIRGVLSYSFAGVCIVHFDHPPHPQLRFIFSATSTKIPHIFRRYSVFDEIVSFPPPFFFNFFMALIFNFYKQRSSTTTPFTTIVFFYNIYPCSFDYRSTESSQMKKMEFGFWMFGPYVDQNKNIPDSQPWFIGTNLEGIKRLLNDGRVQGRPPPRQAAPLRIPDQTQAGDQLHCTKGK